MSWPNDAFWKALADGGRFEHDGRLIPLEVVDCGELVVPYGRLTICDPFALLEPNGNPVIPIPPGRYPVKVTLADGRGSDDGFHIREAYASLLLSDAQEVVRREFTPVAADPWAAGFIRGEWVGVPVDAGTVCFVDEGALPSGMPARDRWYADVFAVNDRGWFDRIDHPNHLRHGLANVPLPLAADGSNAILIHSGWGDGIYPIVGGYDANRRLVRIHVDFSVVGAPEDDPYHQIALPLS